MTSAASASPDRLAFIRRAVDQWRKQLVDLTGNNRLIYYKPLKSGTINLEDVEPLVLSSLLAGRKVELRELVPPDHDEQAVIRLIRSAKTIAGSATANFEEKGIQTLFLTSHLATWDARDTSKATPNAPALLAPLKLAPKGAGGTEFTLQLTGPWEINQTLIIFWSEIFGIRLEQSQIDALTEQHEDHTTLVSELQRLVDSAGEVPSLSFGPGHYIGNFAYTKLPMVKDLEASVDALAQNDLIAAIAGDPSASAALSSANHLDGIDVKWPDTVVLNDEHLVLDADSSQSYVVNAAMATRSLVVEGPPGTGKSQTIANVIASMAAEGRTVLFVAEKRAAIEAVLKRLQELGLGELALDLHQSTIRRQDTAQSLADSLQVLASAAPPDVRRDQAQLTEARSRLVEYERELHLQRDPWGTSSFQVNQELAQQSEGVHQVRLDEQLLRSLTPERRVGLESLIEDWVASYNGINRQSLWLRTPIPTVETATQLVQLARQLRDEILPRIQSISQAIAGRGIGRQDSTLESLRHLCAVTGEVAVAETKFSQQIWTSNPAGHAEIIRNRPVAGLGREYRATRKQLHGLLKTKLKRKACVEALDGAAQTLQRWQLHSVSVAPHQPAEIAQLGPLLDAWHQRLGPIAQLLPADADRQNLSALGQVLDSYLMAEQEATQLARLNELRASLLQQRLQLLVDGVEQGTFQAAQTPAVFEASYLAGVQRLIAVQTPVLSSFETDRHSQVVERFTESDRRHRETAPQRVLRRAAEKAIAARNAAPEQSAIIEREAKKKRRHRSLRQLRTDAPDVLMALRPCWIMSPLMVSQTLPSDELFDCVVFDEASQVKPEEAIASLLRGRQVVIAGDRRQLPPSAFFGGSDRDIDELAEYEDSEVDAMTSGYESILDVTSTLLPTRMLQWHYRSEDERLISYSNEHIYGRGLITFPGAKKDTPVTFHKVDHRPSATSEIKSNPSEVQRVVDLAIECARQRPDESLGVIAFGQVHATNIENQLASTLADEGDPLLERFFVPEGPERFFVKNIERVQGDERDAIILSVGYGKDLNGTVPLRFGPVNQEGGERRLNVAASRSRRRMMVVSSISHRDFDASALKRGPQMLNALLQFAESGGATTGADPLSHPLNPFEQMVKLELEALGLNPICQYGSSNFRIDFALAHPDDPGRMVLAVEADGATYHSSQTARDRDRLRQQMLERLGWRFHRIWSTAFFKDPKGEAAKVLQSYKRALAAESLSETSAAGAPVPTPHQVEPVGNPTAEPAVSPPETVQTPVPPVQPSGRPRPRLRQGLSIDEYKLAELVALAQWITNDGEQLMTDGEVKAKMKEELGYKRMGNRISDAFDRAIAATKRSASPRPRQELP